MNTYFKVYVAFSIFAVYLTSVYFELVVTLCVLVACIMLTMPLYYIWDECGVSDWFSMTMKKNNQKEKKK